MASESRSEQYIESQLLKKYLDSTARCEHKSCSAAEKVWLPYEIAGRGRGLMPHSYCIHCGAVKNISADKAKPLGYYTNILAKMAITKVQIRLIIKELEKMNFDDTYSMTKSDQEKVFNKVIKKYSKINRN
ncbi:MAG: hypothetical protein H0M93_04315 [Methanophagales archaeon]|nr:hypothetical protein [Methanophagales archaeon]